MIRWAALVLCLVFAAEAPALSVPVSSTLMNGSRESYQVEVQTRQIKVSVSPQMNLTLPDGDSRILVEHELDDRKFQMGTRYNFIFGKIKYWATYGMPVVKDIGRLEATASDDIGFGRVYFNERFLERARSGILGAGFKVGGNHVMASAGRTSWRLAPFDNPNLEDSGLIDEVGIEIRPKELLPIQVDPIQREGSVIRFRHGFRGMGGDYHFDKFEADVPWLDMSLPRGGSFTARTFFGQAYNVYPKLPLRETYALGGAVALKGYGYEEFRGEGVFLAGAEYAVEILPAHELGFISTRIVRTDLLFFVDTGRINRAWVDPIMALKWSGGTGVALKGTVLQRYQGRLRLYAAQALEFGGRRPIYYALVDLK